MSDGVVWLHLSDLHRGHPGERARWGVAREAVLRDLREMAGTIGPPDLVLFTGDLAFGGTEEDYRKVDETLDEVLEAAGGDPVLVPVPGNHDLDRSRIDGTLADAGATYHNDGGSTRQAFIRGDASTLERLARPFSGYAAWWERRVRSQWEARGLVFRAGHLPGDFLLTLRVKDMCLGVAGLNSAFLHLGDDQREGSLAVEPEQLPGDLSRWVGQHEAALLLAHHPTDWLHPDRKQAFLRGIHTAEYFAALLFGHMHKPRSWSTVDAGQRTRHMEQAASLFGLERWGKKDEVRPTGYAWARLTREGPTEGRLERWYRTGGPVQDMDLVIDKAHGTKEPEVIAVSLRPPCVHAGRRVAVVAVTDELGAERAAVVERLGRVRGVAEATAVRAEQEADARLLDAADLVVVLLGWTTGTAGVLERAVEDRREPVVVRAPTPPRPDLLRTDDLLRIQQKHAEHAAAPYLHRPQGGGVPRSGGVRPLDVGPRPGGRGGPGRAQPLGTRLPQGAVDHLAAWAPPGALQPRGRRGPRPGSALRAPAGHSRPVLRGRRGAAAPADHR